MNRLLIAGVVINLLAVPVLASENVGQEPAGVAANGTEPASRGQPPLPVPLTLAECYRLALKQSEALAIHQELIAEAEARFTSAFSALLPRVSFVSSDKRQDGTGSSAFTLRHVPERKFALSQPLFSGFREFAALRGSKAEQAQRRLEKAHAEQLLLMDVADAFYLSLELRDDLGALAMIRQALAARLADLAAREQIGRSRPSEVVSAEAALRRVEAEGHDVRRQQTVARHLMEFLTGMEPLGSLTDAEPALPAVGPESAYLAKAIAQPGVHATEQAARVAKAGVAVAGADRWPTVDLDGNYYVERVGNAKDVDWDATVEVDVPIFQGGEVAGAIRAAESQARQADWEVSSARRSAVRDVRDRHAQVTAAIAQAEALTRALEAADESYRLQVEDYDRALVNHLEVLQALQALQDVRRDAIHAQHEAKRSAWRLRASVGERPS